MSLTRYLPTPSDRMGILWTLLQIKDVVVLEYGTAGTTAYALKNFMMSDIQLRGQLFTTELRETELVLGEDTRLENKIKELDETLSPKVIFVMASSVSSVTGYDVEGVCRCLQGVVTAKLIVFPQGGFSGDFSSGVQVAYTKLVEELAENPVDIEDFYNVLGVSAMSSHGVGDVKQVESMMKEHFDLQPNAVLSCDTDLEKIATMAKAKVNLVLSYEGLKGAKLLQERFGTPYVYGFPVGTQSKEDFIREISTHIPRKTEENSENTLNKGGKLAVYAPYDVLLGMHKYAKERGLEIQFLLCTHSLKEVEHPSEKILFYKTEKEKIKLFEALNHTTVIGEDTFFSHINKSNQMWSLSVKNRHDQVAALFGNETLFQQEN